MASPAYSSFAPAASAQQPFASPQPAPVTGTTPGANAASPPTKQSLKSWWKQFRPPAKGNSEPQGISPDQLRQVLSKQNYSLDKSSLLLQRSFHGKFIESLMGENDAVVAHVSGSDVDFSTSQRTNQKTLQPVLESTSSPEVQLIHFHSLPIQDSSTKTFKRHSTLLRSTDSSDGFEVGAVPGKKPRPKSQIFTFSACSEKSDSTYGEAAQISQSDTSCEVKTTDKLKNSVILRTLSANSCILRTIQRFRANKTVNKVESPTGIFGVPLRQSITYANVAISLVDAEGRSYIYGYVPIVVAKCGVFLKEKATNVEGIFRLSGSEKRIKELKTVFDSPDRYGKGLDWAGYTVHDAANVLRRYLNQLPEPIVPLDLYEQFRDPLRGHTIEAVGDVEGPQLKNDFDINKAIATYQRLITELPPLNRQLLLYILDLLAVFASKSDENRMTAQNLAAIFQPGILSHPSHDMAPKEYRLSQDVLIFLIDNQDHFLIGMRGTAADEQTVQEVQNGGTPPPGTPKTPAQRAGVARTASNASAGADSVRKFGGIRRNVSVSSKNSRQSNGAPSPGSPALNSPGGVHRSNTVPSKRSPALPSARLKKHSGTPSPTAATFGTPDERIATARGLSPAAVPLAERNDVPISPGLKSTTTDVPTLAPVESATPIITSQERLLGDQQELQTPAKERNLTSLFQRSPTMDNDKKQPNKLRKKRAPGSSNPSAHSSTNSLPQQPSSISPGIVPTDVSEHPNHETIPSDSLDTPPTTETPRAEQSNPHNLNESDVQQTPDRNLKPAESPKTSLRSQSSFNDQSDMDHRDEVVIAEEQREKRSRWRLSRHRDNSASLGNSLSPRKALGSDAAGASTSSIGSSARPRKSFTGENALASDSTLVGTQQPPTTESGALSSEEKKGPLGWIKNKMREKREEKEAEKERNKSPPAPTDRIASVLPSRGKSMDVRREDLPPAQPVVEERVTHQIAQVPPPQQQ